MKKAKKFLVGLLALASVSAFAWGVTGCNDKKTNVGTGNFPSSGLGGLGGGGGATHKHTYDQEVVDEKYAQTAADCLNGGVYYKSCECGAKGTETFSASALGHTGDFCTRCNQNVASEGLIYKLANDGASYIVIDIGDCTDSNLYIPNEHEGLPVSGIGDKAFDYCSTLTSVTIPDPLTIPNLHPLRQSILP